MIRTILLLVAMPTVAVAQSVYDFEGLTGSDMHPFTPLNGQDGWTEETFNAGNPTGVTETLSHDGSQSLRFQEVGPGYGSDASRINDSSWSFAPYSGTETNAYFQVDMLVGFWGGSYGVAHDANGNGLIRGSELGERGVRFVLGTQSNVQFRLVDASGASTQASLAGTGITGGDWVRVRVVMDLSANGGQGLGYVDAMILGAGPSNFAPVAGLQGVPLMLSSTATDASNPAMWDAMWLHFEGATYGIDNVEIGLFEPGTNYCSAAANSTGSIGTMSATGSTLASANDMTLTASGLPLGQFGIFVTSMSQGFVIGAGGTSNGNLCVAGSIGRYSAPGQIQSSGNTGSFSLALDLTATPQGSTFVSIAAGETWNFQAWYRDNVGLGSNFTDGYELEFQ